MNKENSKDSLGYDLAAEIRAAAADTRKFLDRGRVVLEVLANIGARNRCGARSRAGLEPGAVENVGTSEGVRKAWQSRHAHGEISSPHEEDWQVDMRIGGGATQAGIHAELGKGSRKEAAEKHKFAHEHFTKKAAEYASYAGDERSQMRHQHADNWMKKSKAAASKAESHKKAAERFSASNSTMLEQFSPSPMIGKYAAGKARRSVLADKLAAKNAAFGSKYEEAKHPRYNGKWTHKRGAAVSAGVESTDSMKKSAKWWHADYAETGHKIMHSKIGGKHYAYAEGVNHPGELKKGFDSMETAVKHAQDQAEEWAGLDEETQTKKSETGGQKISLPPKAIDTGDEQAKPNHTHVVTVVSSGGGHVSEVQPVRFFSSEEAARKFADEQNKRPSYGMISSHYGVKSKEEHKHLFGESSAVEKYNPFTGRVSRVKTWRTENKRTSTAFNAEQLAIGTKHEMEHTKDPKVARKIAADHLAEDPKYYTKLKQCMKD